MNTRDNPHHSEKSLRPSLSLRLLDLGIYLAFAAQVVVCWAAPKEDVYICFRYARHWARGQGLVYNPGEYAEGYSNSIWTMALGALHWTGLTLFAADNLLVLVCALAAVAVLCRASVKAFGDTWPARLPALLLLLYTSVPASFGNGLEGSGTALGVALMILGLVEGGSLALGLGVALLVLLRPEGFLYAGAVAAYCLPGMLRSPGVRRRNTAILAMITGTFVCLAAFRWWYYGDVIPNTVRAKENLGSLEQVRTGIEYVCQYLDPANAVLAVLAVASLLFHRFRTTAAVMLLCAGANAVVVVENGGDWMPHLRLLTPFFATVAFLAAAAVTRLRQRHGKTALLLAALLLAVSLVHFQPGLLQAFAKDLPFETRRMMDPEIAGFASFGDACAELVDYQRPDELLVSEWGGMPPFVLDGLRTIELLGLTDRELARYRGPGVDYVPTGGRIVWPLILKRNPSLMLLFTPFLEKRLTGIDKADPRALDRFLVAQRIPMEEELISFMIRADRPLLAKTLRCAGMVTPARDFLDAFPDTPFGTVCTPWMAEGWRRVDGVTLASAWRPWNDELRFSVCLPLSPEGAVYAKTALDDSPVLLLVGRHVFLTPHVEMSVAALNTAGERHVLHTRTLLDGPGEKFAIDAVTLENGTLAKGDIIEVSFDSPDTGGVFLAAYRWTKTALPELPAGWHPAEERFAAVPELPAEPDVERLRGSLHNDPQNAAASVMLGGALLRTGQLDEAAGLLLRGAAFDRGLWPAAAAALHRIAEQYVSVGRWTDATRLLERSAFLDRGNLEPFLKVGALLEQASQTDVALGLYRTVLSHKPDLAGARLGLARMLALRGDAPSVLETLRALPPVAPGQEGARAASLDWMAEVLVKSSELQAAADILRQSVNLEPGNFQHTMLLAGVLEQLNDLDAALALYRTVVTALPESPKSSERIDAIHAARGDAPGRAALWRDIAGKHPESVNPWKRLADALEAAGDGEGAAKARALADANASESGS